MQPLSPVSRLGSYVLLLFRINPRATSNRLLQAVYPSLDLQAGQHNTEELSHIHPRAGVEPVFPTLTLVQHNEGKNEMTQGKT